MKTLKGKVISVKMTKTAIVMIVGFWQHPLYGKILKRNIKIHAANKIGAMVDDQVLIKEIKPLAKTVNFEIIEILTKKAPVLKPKVKVEDKAEVKEAVKDKKEETK